MTSHRLFPQPPPSARLLDSPERSQLRRQEVPLPPELIRARFGYPDFYPEPSGYPEKTGESIYSSAGLTLAHASPGTCGLRRTRACGERARGACAGTPAACWRPRRSFVAV